MSIVYIEYIPKKFNKEYINNSFFILASFRITDLVQKQPPELFYKKGVLKIFAKFTGKHLCRCFFFGKMEGLSPATVLKKNSNTVIFL